MDNLTGLMLVKCCECGASLPSAPVPANDPANGKTSHGYCPPCERIMWDSMVP